MRFSAVHKSIQPRTHLYDLARGRLAQPVKALCGAQGHINAGEFVAVHGPNGSGKTTLLSLLAGTSTPDAGGVTAARPPTALLGARAGLISHVTIGKQLDLSMASAADRELRQTVIERLELTTLLERRGDELSAGQKARCAVGCAILAGCHTWLLDELTSALDDDSLSRMMLWLRQRGDTVVLVAHDGRATVDRTILLRAGQTETATVASQPEPEPTPPHTMWRGLRMALRFVAATERRPGPWIRRILVTLAGLILPWQLSQDAKHPQEMAATMWCGLAALGLQVAAGEDGLRRLSALIATGLDDVLRARGVGLGSLTLACVAPPLCLSALWALCVPYVVTTLLSTQTTLSLPALALCAAAFVAISGVSLLTFSLAILLRNSSPLPWLLHLATLAVGPVAPSHTHLPAFLRILGEHLPAALLAPALRNMAGLAAPMPHTPWLTALAWLVAGLLFARAALLKLAHQGSLGLRTL